MVEPDVKHRRLSCGAELAVMRLPGRPVVALDIRLFAGFAFEPAEYRGVAHVLDETIAKGTARRDGRALNDAFDAIGATHGSYAGRETAGFSCLCLPEFIDQALSLQAEMLRMPTFPEDACRVAVELAHQALDALNDDPIELTKKYLHQQAYGEPLGRHRLGEHETLERIGREQVVAQWRRGFAASGMFAAVAGDIEFERMADLFERTFGGFGPPDQTVDRPRASLHFSPGRSHHQKDLEQSQVQICFPGCAVTDPDFHVQQVMVGVLAGGMSGRLFTEVREKQGLVYWVGAWGDYPREAGVIHIGASTTPQRVGQTYRTLLREVARLGEDLTEQEVQRAVTGLISQLQTRGDVTRARALMLADDLFYFGRPRPLAERIARLKAVTVEDIRQYLEKYPRDRLSVVTVGREPLGEHD